MTEYLQAGQILYEALTGGVTNRGQGRLNGSADCCQLGRAKPQTKKVVPRTQAMQRTLPGVVLHVISEAKS